MENFYSEEKSKFNALATDWWETDGSMGVLHDINPVRLEYIQRHADLKGKHILDIGCGGGILAEAIASQGGIVTGIDISEQLIKIANMHRQKKNLDITYACTTVEKWSNKQKYTYDVITCMELLEHVPDPISILQACKQLIKPQGLLILSTINRNLNAYLQTKIIAEYLLRLIPAGTHEYKKYRLPSELASWCRNSGFNIMDISGMTYLPMLRKAYISDKSGVNYLMCVQEAE